MYFFTSNILLGTFSTSGSPKSPRLCAFYPHQLHKPSNEAVSCISPEKDCDDVPTIENDDDTHPCPVVTMNTTPILNPTNR